MQSITVERPYKLLNANDRGNDHGRGHGEWRDAAFWWAKQHHISTRGAVGPVEIWIEFGTTQPKKRRDPHNFFKTVKAVCDGFTHAAVWPDDDSTHVHTVEPVFTDSIGPTEVRINLSWEDGNHDG